MKKILCLLLAALTLLLAGCGVSDQEVVDSIPTLSLEASGSGASDQDVKDAIPALSLETGGNGVEIPAYSYSWTVTNRLGRGASIIADAVHPLDAQADLPTVALSGGETASLYFSLVPDSVTVTYWGAQETDHENSAQVETAYLNDTFRFTTPEAEGPLVFQITAQWTGYQDVSGTVSYAFTTAAEE